MRPGACGHDVVWHVGVSRVPARIEVIQSEYVSVMR